MNSLLETFHLFIIIIIAINIINNKKGADELIEHKSEAQLKLLGKVSQ